MKRISLTSGLIASIIAIYLVLLGVTGLIGTLIQGWLGLSSPVFGVWLSLVIVAMWGGAWAVKQGAEARVANPRGAIAASLPAGLLHGFVMAMFFVLIGTLIETGVPVREWLVQLTPEAVGRLLLGNSLWFSALLTLVVLTLANIGGALLRYVAVRHQWGAVWRQYWNKTCHAVWAKPGVQRAVTHPHARRIASVIAFVILLTAPLYLGRYWNYTLGTVGIYVILGLGLNVVVGMAGLLDLGYVGFFAIGAYTMALLTAPEPHGIMMSFWLALPIAVVMAAFAGLLLGTPVLRMRGDYLAIVTLGFGEIIRILARSDVLIEFTGGPRGVRSIGGPVLFGLNLNNEFYFMYFIILGIILVAYITHQLQRSRVGRAWMAIREDEDVAEAMGINTLKYKLMAFMMGASLAGFSGAFYASRNKFAGPEDFMLLVTINVLCLVIIGGMGSIPGVIVGALVLKGLPEILRELSDYRMLAFGALLMLMMILRPEGILPSSRRKMELRPDEEFLESEPNLSKPSHLSELGGAE